MRQRERHRGLRASALIALLSLFAACHSIFGGFNEEVLDCPSSPEKYRCNGEYLLERVAGECTQWSKLDPCDTVEQCDEVRGVCLECARAGTRRCYGAERQVCAIDRSKWETVETCERRELCGPLECGCRTPGELQCSIDENKQSQIRECMSNGEWEVVTNCANQEVCGVALEKARMNLLSWDRQCQPVCTQNELSCDRSSLQRCENSGARFRSLGACASAAFCLQKASEGNSKPEVAATWVQCPTPDCGPPGAPSCSEDGRVLRICKADQTGFDEFDCPAPTRCSTNDGGACIVCDVGDAQCNGRYLEVCQADRSWRTEKDCLSSALCQLTQNETTGLRSGICRPKICESGQLSCGTDETPGAGSGRFLSRCNDDLESWTRLGDCLTQQLCSATRTDCIPPECDTPGTLRCSTENERGVLQECPSGRDRWNTVTTCKAGEFCMVDRNDPCDVSCPDPPFRCNGRFRQQCSPETGWFDVSVCASDLLCQCVLKGNCEGGVNAGSCGNPVCGGSLAQFRCVGSGSRDLQRCAEGRNAWEDVGRCEPGMCFSGTAPGYTNGACLVCQPNETRCFGGERRTCSSDQRGWMGETTCQHGCVENGTNDQCAVCPEGGESRCFENQLRSCAGNRLAFVAPGTDCPKDCVNSGFQDYCAICSVGERYCAGSGPGSALETCLADRKGFGAPTTSCQYGCASQPSGHDCVTCTPIDDSNPCTIDNCSQAGQPQNEPAAAGVSCSDGDPCNGEEICDGSARCMEGVPLELDDENPCTDDACTSSGGVTHTPVRVGTACFDDNPCTADDACNAAGRCTGTETICSPSSECHLAGTCDPQTGTCSNPPRPNGTPCDDRDVCTVGDQCSSRGSCAGTPKCLPSAQCHVAECNPTTGACSNLPEALGAVCDDGRPCTSDDQCDGAGVCAGTSACDDNNPCTTDDCGALGACVYAANTATCDDGEACTVNDRCSQGACAGTPKSCNDNNPCTTDSCGASGACVNTPNPAATCSDGNGCTTDTCNALGVCVSDPSCNDADPCTTEDTCSLAGLCLGTPILCGVDQICVGGECVPLLP